MAPAARAAATGFSFGPLDSRAVPRGGVVRATDQPMTEIRNPLPTRRHDNHTRGTCEAATREGAEGTLAFSRTRGEVEGVGNFCLGERFFMHAETQITALSVRGLQARANAAEALHNQTSRTDIGENRHNRW